MFIANTSDLMGSDWIFLDEIWPHADVHWAHISGQPQNVLERNVKRPNFGRYRAAFQAASLSKKSSEPSLLVSHLPRMTAATNILRRVLCREVPHVGFAFNFTDLPTGADLRYLRWALRKIDQIVVFSTMEQQLYSKLFEIPIDRVSMLHWAMEPPSSAETTELHPGKDYFCAIGGEGRDLELLASAFRQMPHLHVVVVTRPHCVKDIELPENVTLLTNLPPPLTWKLAQDSMGLIVPLKTEDTACGHITIVGAQLLGIPTIVTRSDGVSDYVSDETSWMMRAQDQTDMSKALTSVIKNPQETQRRTTKAREIAEFRSNPMRWVEFFDELTSHYSSRLGLANDGLGREANR